MEYVTVNVDERTYRNVSRKERLREIIPYVLDIRKRPDARSRLIRCSIRLVYYSRIILYYNYIKIYFLIINAIINEYYKHYLHIFLLSFHLFFFREVLVVEHDAYRG